ncbi:unnamed protein product [Brachionus calyciflorus]|uniref:Endonuclease/exonuclease/phosphatase domain-containing protein n=1 Tax=Brachionus calyciflorus TaxID=104777 RepID=A0A814DNK3_9BILA|nr:unnamed protein product [Brachionus calyciflorus]
MINQAFHTRDYYPELGAATHHQSRPLSSIVNKQTRPSPYDAPTRNHINATLTPQMYLNSYHIPTFPINQPMLPINMQPNRATPNYATQVGFNSSNDINHPQQNQNQYPQINHEEQTVDNTYNRATGQTFTLKFISNKKFNEKFRDYYFLEDYIKEIKLNLSLLTIYINKKDELIIKTDKQEDVLELKAVTSNEEKYKCLEFGHNSANCNNKTKCLRWSGIDHIHKTCKITDANKFKCANCGGNHAACSKTCPELIKAVDEKKRGGVALGVNDSLKCKKIDLEEFVKTNEKDEKIGLEIELENKEALAIFSYYLSPNSTLNNEFFEKAKNKYKNLLIIGDLNCINQAWFCKNNNLNGINLEKIVDKLNLFVLNNEKATYKRSDNILDLSICSNNLIKFFSEYKVIDSNLSEHNTTLNIFKNLNQCQGTQKVSKIDWVKFIKILEKDVEINFYPLNPVTLDKAAAEYIENLQKAIEKATVSFEIEDNIVNIDIDIAEAFAESLAKTFTDQFCKNYDLTEQEERRL